MRSMEPLERRLVLAAGLDPSFGAAGIALADFGGVDEARSVITLPDGGLLAGGQSSNRFALARFTSGGALDPSFGTAGRALDPASTVSRINALAVQQDGSIVAAGLDEAFRFAIFRFNADGSLDTSFGDNGRAVLPLSSTFAEATAVAVQPDGRIIAGGRFRGGNNFDVLLARLNPSGTLDTSFGPAGNGLVAGDFVGDDALQDLRIASGGRIVIAGSTERDALVAGFTQQGALDRGFGGRGFVLLDLGADESANALTLTDSSQVVLGGESSGRWMIARLTSAGVLDPTFGSGGAVLTDLGSAGAVNDVVVLPGGDVVAGGNDQQGGFVLGRWTAAGVPDATFAPGGLIREPASDGARLNALTLQENRVVAAGRLLGTGPDFGLGRYNVQSSTGISGRTLIVIGTDAAEDIAVSLSGGTILVSVGGATEQFNAGLVDRVEVRGLRGADRIDLSALSMPVSVSGGAGADTILGSAVGDTLYGNGGPDSILGLAGEDSLSGGGGSDTLESGSGADVLDGGRGDDLLMGAQGPDTLVGQDGFDRMLGNGGADLFFARDQQQDELDGGGGVNSAQVDDLDLLTNIPVLLA